MSVYKIDDLISSLQSAKSDGYEYVSVTELEADDDFPASLDLDYRENSNTGETDSIDSVILPENYQADLK